MKMEKGITVWWYDSRMGVVSGVVTDVRQWDVIVDDRYVVVEGRLFASEEELRRAMAEEGGEREFCRSDGRWEG